MINTKYYWLNEDSRKFLERGYLLEGETPEERFKDIAKTAERYLGIDGFANKFEDYLSRGFYSISSPIISNFGRLRGLPISCVVGDTWINTKSGGGKMAKDIEIGDEVLTHRGRYRKVIDIIPTKNKNNIFKLKVSNRMTPLYLTGNHLVLTNVGWVRTDELNPDLHLVAINGDIESVEKDYTIDMKSFCNSYNPHVIDGKIYKEISKNTKSKTTKNGKTVEYFSNPFEFIEIDEDLAWAFGLWFAEGSVSKNNKKEPVGIRITTNDKDEAELTHKWLNIMKSKLNLNGNTYTGSTKRGDVIYTWLTTDVNSQIIGNLFHSFGDGCKNKLIPEWIMELPKQKLKYFLDGLLAGDGTITKCQDCRITVANPKMLLQIYQIGLKLGLGMSLQMQEKSSVLSTTPHTYTCNFRKYNDKYSKNNSNSAIKFYDGLRYAKIKELHLTEKVEDVYDFTVDEDHSFSASGVVLHNCFGSYIPDTMEGILNTLAEVGQMTKAGGGTSGYFGALRGRGASISSGGSSTGAVHFMELYNKLMNVVSQGNVRRGSFAGYLPIDHPDIEEFLKIRSDGHEIQDMSIGVCVSNDWMSSMIAGDATKRKIWGKVIQKRFESGYPYIFFSDNANDQAPEIYKATGRKIHNSNLCSEIFLSNDENESFVCDLSSLNLEKWEEWKDTDAVETLVYFLDAVMSEFITKTTNVKFMEAPRNFAVNQRALGVGVLGWHSLLQDKMIAFESMDAKLLNMSVWSKIREKADKATEELAKLFGCAPIYIGSDQCRRNVTTLAVAPTTSSSFILGQVSPSIEPLNSNYYTKDLAKGKFTFKNPYLIKLLESKDKNNQVTWKSILVRGGSVQHLKFLTQEEKDVFKTFGEISQKEIVIQAIQRQKFIDQGQSLNLMIPPNTKPKEVNELMIFGWENGIKSFYYQRSSNPAQELARNILNCTTCEA